MKHTKQEPLRKCRDCGLEAYTAEDLEGFRKGPTYKHGRDNLCLGCENTRTSEYRAENRNDHEYHVRCRLAASKSRAKKAKVPHTITIEDILEVDSDICPCCSEPQTWDPDAEQTVTKSLDRTVPELGYVPGNITLICGNCNRLKAEHTIESLEMILSYMKRTLENGRLD